jgi:integrase
MAVAQTPDGRWYSYWRVGRAQRRQYFGHGASAEISARAFDAARPKQKRPPRPLPVGPSFEAIAIDYARRRKFNPNSRKCLLLRLSANILPVLGHKPAIRITDRDIDQYIAVRSRPKKVANQKTAIVPRMSTIRREIADIKAIMSWAARRKLIPTNPIAAYQKPEPDDESIIPPSADEVSAILAAAPDHLQRAIILSWYTGLRPGAVELFTLSWDSWVRQHEYLRVVSAHKGGPALRDVPVHPSLRAHLERWHDQDGGRGPIIHYKGCAIRSIRRSWNATLRRAGIKRRLRPYDLRHHFVTRALEAGADIGALAGVVGSSPQTLRKYYQHVTDDLRRRAVVLVPDLPSGKKE